MLKSRSNSRKILSLKLDLAPTLPWSTDCFGQNHGGHREQKKKMLVFVFFSPHLSQQALNVHPERVCG